MHGLSTDSRIDGHWINFLFNPRALGKGGASNHSRSSYDALQLHSVAIGPTNKTTAVTTTMAARNETEASGILSDRSSNRTIKIDENQGRHQNQAEPIPFQGGLERLWKYDYGGVNQEVLDYAHKWIHTENCENDHNALIARCCTNFVCGGMADRVRGILLLTMAAEKANKRLCLPRDYFIPSVRPYCPGGNYMVILRSSFLIYQNPMEPRVRPRGRKMTDMYDPTKDNPGKYTRYISTVRNARDRRIGITSSQDIKRFGVLAVALSQSMDRDMSQAQHKLESCLKKPLDEVPHVALHIRCGGSLYTDGNGTRRAAITNWKDGYNTSVPDDILRAARKLPPLTCRKPLYISTDSLGYKHELMKAIPKGIRTVSCSKEALHVGFSRPISQRGSRNHLIDLEAIGSADAIFRTVGGFAELGSVAMGWGAPQIYSWPTRPLGRELSDGEEWAFEDRQRHFFRMLLINLDCSKEAENEEDV